MNKAVVGLGLAAVAGAAFLLSSEGEAAARPTAPNGTNLDDLALATTVSLTTQNIPDVNRAVELWVAASDPITAGTIKSTLDSAVAGVNLAQSLLDGEKGSPLLRAFGLRVLNLEGRPALLRIWAKTWKTILPKLSEALSVKAGDIKPSITDGTTDDPIPPPELLQKIIQAVASGNTAEMRRVADELDRAGFKEQAKDLRAAADAIDKGKAEPPAPPAPGPTPDVPGPGPSPVTPKPQPVPPAPDPVTPPTPAPTNGGTYVVKSGDNPSKIAKAFTGNANRWPELVKANAPPKKKAKDGNFATLNAGETLKLPANWPKSPSVSPSTPVPPTPSNGGTYVVKSGDNPSKIALAFTGNANRWTELVAANSPPKKRAANGNFATLNAGETLKLPANWPQTPGGTAKPPVNPSSTPTSTKRRTLAVQSGDGLIRITKRAGQPESSWRELRDANIPTSADGKTHAKDTDAKGGLKPPIQIGERLNVPANWSDNSAMVFGADGGAASSDAVQAGRVALMAKNGRVNQRELAAFQQKHGIEPNGCYGPMTAFCLCFKFGMVPPTPHVWGSHEKAARQQYADTMIKLGKRDPQRQDEFAHAARQAVKGNGHVNLH